MLQLINKQRKERFREIKVIRMRDELIMFRCVFLDNDTYEWRAKMDVGTS